MWISVLPRLQLFTQGGFFQYSGSSTFFARTRSSDSGGKGNSCSPRFRQPKCKCWPTGCRNGGRASEAKKAIWTRTVATMASGPSCRRKMSDQARNPIAKMTRNSSTVFPGFILLTHVLSDANIDNCTKAFSKCLYWKGSPLSLDLSQIEHAELQWCFANKATPKFEKKIAAEWL